MTGMKPLDALRAAHIYNAFNLVKAACGAGVEAQPVYITYSPASKWHGSKWSVSSPYFKTNPSAHWLDNGTKTFTPYRYGSRAQALEAAKAWATQEYGVQEWARVTGLGSDWFPKPTADYAASVVKEQRAKAKATS